MAAPVGLARLVIQIASGLTIGVIVAVGLAYAPGLVADGAVVVAAGAPPEEVAVCVLAVAVLASGGAKDIPLVLREFPVRRGSAADVLQVALREIHLVAIAVNGELAFDDSYKAAVLNSKIRRQGAATVHREGINGVGGHHLSVLRPINEGVALISCSRERTSSLI